MTTTILDNAYARIDGFKRRRAILDALGVGNYFSPQVAVQGFEPTAPVVREQIEHDVETLAAAGKPIPANIGAAIVEAERADAAALARTRAVQAVAERAWNSAVVNRTSIAPALAYLRDELERVLTDAATLAGTVGAIESADQALTAGGDVQDAWRQLQQATADYREIRSVQAALMRDVLGLTGLRERLEHAGHFVDSLDVDPYWSGLRQAAVQDSKVRYNDRQILAYERWLIDDRGESRIYSTTGERQLLAIADAGTAWIANADQLEAAWDAARRAVRQPSPQQIDDMEQARAAYYATTGATPTGTFTRTTPTPMAEAEAARIRRMKEAQERQRIRDRIGDPDAGSLAMTGRGI